MIVFSQSFREFIFSCDNKIAKYLRGYLEWGYPVYKNLFTESEINYITFRNDGTISYLPKGKEHQENENGDWKRDGRQNGKPSVVIKKIITQKGLKLLKQKDFENFTNCYKAEYNEDGLSFIVHDNKQIPSIYNEELAEGDGSLNNSCMKGEDKDFFDIYKHCKDLKILTLWKDQLLCGRALVWSIKDITLMDRVYIAKEHYYELFFKYARDNKWWRKAYQNYSEKEDFINPEGEQITKTFKIYTDTCFDYYPYIDTFTYGDEGFLTNSGGYTYSYNNTDGTRDGEDTTTWDEINQCDIDEDDAVTIDRGYYRNDTTHIDNTVVINGDRWWEEDDDIICIDGDWYEKDDSEVTINALTDEYDLKDNLTSVDCGKYEGEYIDEDDCVTDVDGNIWWVDDSGLVCLDGDYYPEDHEDVELINGNYQLKQEECTENY